MLTRLRYYHHFDFYVVAPVHHLHWTSDNSYSFVEVLLCKSTWHLTFCDFIYDKTIWWNLVLTINFRLLWIFDIGSEKQNRIKMNCCDSMLKYIVFLCNFVFFLTGCAVLGIGIYVQLTMKDYYDFLEEKYLGSAIILMVVGGVILIVAFFGCCGACTGTTDKNCINFDIYLPFVK